MRSATRIFRPEVYDQVFPPTPVEQMLRNGMEDEGEPITPDDFASIEQFIRGLSDLKSTSIMADDEGWV